jgi:cytochrome oxidase assembly protein ShyY1
VYGFAFRGRWLVGHFVVAALAGLFVLAGMWQLDRLHQVREQNALIRARRHLPVVDLQRVVTASDSSPGKSLQRRVIASGRYDGSAQAVQFRAEAGQTGIELLTPLVLADGTAVIVDRGWLPTDTPDVVPPEAAPPQEEVTVTGYALPGDPSGAATSQSSGPLEVTRVDLDILQRHMGHDLFPVYLRLQSQRPAQESRFPQPIPPPPVDNGPHLSYAIQWFTFTVIGLIGWPLVIRKAARDRVRA